MHPPFDRAHLMTFTDGDAVLERELLLSFQENAHVHLANLRLAAENGSWPEMAHRFKGAASGVGMKELAALCAQAEDGDADLSAQQRESLLSAMQAELAKLAAYLGA